MTILKDLEDLRRETEEWRKLEKEDNDTSRVENPFWIDYGKGSSSYDLGYGNLTKEGQLAVHIANKALKYRDNGYPICILDGGAPLSSWLEKLQKRNEDGTFAFDGGVAFTLDDPRRSETKIKRDAGNLLYTVAGDITKAEPRQELHRVMRTLGIEDIGFGIVMFRLYGGAMINKGERKFIPLYYSLLRQFWKITSSFDGEIFCPIPNSLAKTEIFHKWVSLMRNEVKAEIDLGPMEVNMKITKHEYSRKKLPGFGEMGIN